MIQVYFVQEVVRAVKPVHYEQSATKYSGNLKAERGRHGHDCVIGLTIEIQAV